MEEVSKHKALQDYVVLTKIFQHLEPIDLLQCRLVCKMWRDFSKSEFLSNVWLHFSDRNYMISDSDIPKNFRNFYQTFPTSSNTHQFRRVKLKGNFDANEVETFFCTRPFIKEIIFSEVTFFREGKDLKNYDIGVLLTGLNLRKLLISNNFCPITFNEVRLTMFPNIESICLKYCPLIHTPNQLICPEELHLYGDENNMMKMLIETTDGGNGALQFSDFVDVKKLKILNLNMLGYREVNLDLAQAKNLEQLHLATDTNLTGFHENLSLKRLKISQYLMEQPICVRLNLSDLPPSLEDLRLCYDDYYNFLSYPMNHDLPQIKSLELTQKTLPLLKWCTRLNDFKFNSYYGSKLNLKYFPLSLKILKLHDNCEVVDAPLNKIELDLLVIEDMGSKTFRSTYKLINTCEPRIVVLKPKPSFWYCLKICLTCSRKLDPYYPLIEHQVNRGGECVIGGVYEHSQQFCDCNGRITPATTYFQNKYENGEYLKFSKDYRQEITKEEFETFMNDTK